MHFLSKCRKLLSTCCNYLVTLFNEINFVLKHFSQGTNIHNLLPGLCIGCGNFSGNIEAIFTISGLVPILSRSFLFLIQFQLFISCCWCSVSLWILKKKKCYPSGVVGGSAGNAKPCPCQSQSFDVDILKVTAACSSNGCIAKRVLNASEYLLFFSVHRQKDRGMK